MLQKTELSKFESRVLNIFWASTIAYTLGAILSSTNALNIKVCQGIQALGVLGMIPSLILLCKAKIDSSYLRVIFPLYIIWFVVIIARGQHLSFSYDYLKDFLFGFNSNGLIYFAPLVLLLPRNFSYYRRFFRVIDVSALLFLILCALFIKKLLIRGDDMVSQNIMENLFDLSIPTAFVLLTYTYHSNKRGLIAFAWVALTLFFSIIRARRGLLFITSCFSIYSIIFYFFQTKRKLSMIYLAIMLVLIGMAFSNKFYNLQNNKLVGFLIQRSDEDTRTPVELLFKDDMKANDWIVGRGIDGSYFAPDVEENQLTNYRTVIETGYLQLILKGGLINLGLLLLITVPAIILGLFFSNNILSKAAAMWVFQFVIDLYPQNSVSFNLSYLMVWVSVGICYSKYVRSLSNSEVRYLLQDYRWGPVEKNKEKRQTVIVH